MDVEANPLLQLEPDKQQQLVDLVQEGDVEAVANATGMSRRSVILAAAALGVGTIGGGVTAKELIQEAQAAASTTDSDGNVGTPQNPVDIFADGISSSSLNTDELMTVPAGVRLTKDSSQTVTSGATTEVTWESASERNSEANAFADLANNAITIPNDQYRVARVGWALRTDTHAWDFVVPRLNGSNFTGRGFFYPSGNYALQSNSVWSDWVAISSGDSFTLDFNQATGSDQNINNDEGTWFSVEVY